MSTAGLWIGFNAVVALILLADLGVLHRRARTISLHHAAAWSLAWIILSLLFNLALLRWYGSRAAVEFLAAYVIEKSLSADNLFVFALIFAAFGVERAYQQRVLLWGVIGAIALRGLLIGVGLALVKQFQWALYIFGVFLVYAGLRMVTRRDRRVHLEKNPIYRWARKFLPLTPEFEGQRFFVRRRGVWRATPLLLVLLVIETADLAFALDSIPAVFAITRDPFIVYSSNVCALLGLRALYFVLANLLSYFRYLSVALSLILVLTGAKMLAEPWIKISTPLTLAAIGSILLVAIVTSVLRPAQQSLSAQSKRIIQARKSNKNSLSEPHP